ncbi:hypothetical protein PE36_01240 [Moritella sp. PE36]|nr:hypothetical protein PE36_01240 [Moritella sp. PE36]
MEDYGLELNLLGLNFQYWKQNNMDEKTIIRGLEALSLIDKDLEKAFKELGAPPARINPHGFESLLFTIVSQQLSTQ